MVSRRTKSISFFLFVSSHLQFDDVWMSEESEILDFPPDLSDDIQLFDLRSIDDLDRHGVSRQLMIGFLHFAETSRAQCFIQDIMTNANHAHVRRRIIRSLVFLFLSLVFILRNRRRPDEKKREREREMLHVRSLTTFFSFDNDTNLKQMRNWNLLTSAWLGGVYFLLLSSFYS